MIRHIVAVAATTADLHRLVLVVSEYDSDNTALALSTQMNSCFANRRRKIDAKSPRTIKLIIQNKRMRSVVTDKSRVFYLFVHGKISNVSKMLLKIQISRRSYGHP